MIKGIKIIRLGGFMFFMASIIFIFTYWFFPKNSIQYTIGLILSAIFLFNFIPIIMIGYLIKEKNKPSKFLTNTSYFLVGFIGSLAIGIVLLIMCIIPFLINAPYLVIIPLYPGIFYILFSFYFLKIKRDINVPNNPDENDNNSN